MFPFYNTILHHKYILQAMLIGYKTNPYQSLLAFSYSNWHFSSFSSCFPFFPVNENLLLNFNFSISFCRNFTRIVIDSYLESLFVFFGRRSVLLKKVFANLRWIIRSSLKCLKHIQPSKLSAAKGNCCRNCFPSKSYLFSLKYNNKKKLLMPPAIFPNLEGCTYASNFLWKSSAIVKLQVYTNSS